MVRVAVAANKGGVGKTTTSLALGVLFEQRDPGSVLLIDADPQRSLLKWRDRATAAGLSGLPAIGAPEGRRVPSPAELDELAGRWGTVIVDTAPGADEGAIAVLRPILGWVDCAVVPVSASKIELDLLPETLTVLRSVRRRDGSGLPFAVLRSRLDMRTRAARELNDLLVAEQVPTFTDAIPMMESVRQWYGGVPGGEPLGCFRAVFDELCAAFEPRSSVEV